MSSSNRFPGKAAFVTGAASGIGRAAAVAFATEGARVAILDRTEDALRQTADAIKDAGGEVLVIGCDVSSPEQVEAAVASTAETFGRLDVAFLKITGMRLGLWAWGGLSDGVGQASTVARDRTAAAAGKRAA